MEGGGPPQRHVHDSIGPFRLTVTLGLKTALLVFCCNFEFVMVFELTFKRQMSPPTPMCLDGNDGNDNNEDGMVTQISRFTGHSQ